MAESLDNSIRENAQSPAKASGDSGSMEQHPLPDQIAADRYLAARQALRARKLPLRLAKLTPPSTT